MGFASAPPQVAPAPAAPSTAPSRAPAKPARVVQRKCRCGGRAGGAAPCSCGQAKSGLAGRGEDEAVRRVQRRPHANAGANPGALGEVVPASSGATLPEPVRGEMQTRFGHDFSRVRIHSGPSADAAARRLDAVAYTAGDAIVFAASAYRPDTLDGRRLLAHELTHVVQQRRAQAVGGGVQKAVQVNRVDGADEREADAVAARVVAGRSAGPLVATPGAGLQRAVNARVTRNFRPNAHVCFVHLHGNEQNALHVAQELRGRFCANLVHLDTTTREVAVSSGGATCPADPNRIFSRVGVTTAAWSSRSCRRNRTLQRELTQWRDGQLVPAIRACRGGTGSGLAGPLPVVAFHNNVPEESFQNAQERGRDLTIRNFAPGRRFGRATETHRARTGGVPNPAVRPNEDVDNFLLVTDPADFQRFRTRRNVVLQSSHPADDGSLSVALASERYINIEVQGKPFHGTRHATFVDNRALAEAVLHGMGVPQPGAVGCPVPRGQNPPAPTPIVPAPAPAPKGGSR